MVDWSTASLRISSEILPASEISKIIGQSPSQSAEKGELMSPRNPKSQKFDNSVWILESGLESSEDLENHLTILISFIEKKVKELNHLQNQCKMDIFCGVSISDNGQGSMVLKSDIIKRISILPLDIVFDLYSET